MSDPQEDLIYRGKPASLLHLASLAQRARDRRLYVALAIWSPVPFAGWLRVCRVRK